MEAIQEFLRPFEYGPNGYVKLIHVPAYRLAEVIVGPTRSFEVPNF